MVKICFSTAPGGGCCASAVTDDAARAAAAATADSLAAELAKLKVSELRRRAEAAGADEQALAAVYDGPEEEQKQAYTDLIIERELAAASAPLGPADPEPEPQPVEEPPSSEVMRGTSVERPASPTLPPRQAAEAAAPTPPPRDHPPVTTAVAADVGAGAAAAGPQPAPQPAPPDLTTSGGGGGGDGGREILLLVQPGPVSGDVPFKLPLQAVGSVEDVHAALQQRFGLTVDSQLRVQFVTGLGSEEYRLLDAETLPYLPAKAKVTVERAPAVNTSAITEVAASGIVVAAPAAAAAAAPAPPPAAPTAQDEEAERKRASDNARARAQMDLGKADKAMEPGTRIRIFGYGEGTYVSCKKKRTGGGNVHTIQFSEDVVVGGKLEIKLKEETTSWRVEDGVVVCDE